MTRFRSRFSLVAVAFLLLGLLPASPAVAADARAHINCTYSRSLCAEVENLDLFSAYVGHDEPSLLFYSNRPGSGNQMRYVLTLPTDPQVPASGIPTAGQSFNFQLHPAFWFGMAMCDTQSSPRPLGDPAHPINPGIACVPNSDTNIHENPSASAPDSIGSHPGTAFMEMQFYPPGWVSWPAGNSCDATKWCAALNIDSLSIDYYHGTQLNGACQSQVGVEPVNFAFITKSGIPHAPPSPVNSTLGTFTPNPATDLFMNSGDRVVVTLRDTEHGLRIDLNDLTTHQSGFMVTSKANGFGQVQYEPNGSVCKNIGYDFHPEYSTSSELTRVPWAAHSYNIAFSDEIGHFDVCSTVTAPGGSCTGTEGAAGDTEPTDEDDNYCFDAADSTLVRISGCFGTNSGFDGTPYQKVWPDGSSKHPTPIVFTSAQTGDGFNVDYSRVAFEADLPRIEAADVSPVNSCNRNTGARCVKPPLTDESVPANFYPFFSAAKGYAGAECAWALGSDIPGHTVNDFGQLDQYGALLKLSYPAFGGLGATVSRYNNFRQVLSNNPCTTSNLDDQQ